MYVYSSPRTHTHTLLPRSNIKVKHNKVNIYLRALMSKKRLVRGSNFEALIFFHRLSGTGSSGATVRLYVDAYESDPANHMKSAAEMLSMCVDVALQISKLKEFTGRDEPTVIT